MTDSAHASPGAGRRRGPLQLLGALFLGIFRRIYALALIALVLWLSWLAFLYLIDTLVLEGPPPPQIVDLPRRLDMATLERPTPFIGATTTENPRTPAGHYHQISGWFQADRLNDCTRSGCHAPLPHGQKKEDRAFLNMHATSIHCGVCHLQTENIPLPLVWYDLADGQTRQRSPALLEAYGLLVAPDALQPQSWTEDRKARLAGQLDEAAADSDYGSELKLLAAHFATVRLDSDEFAALLGHARATLPTHFRGEYGAKLALRDPQTGRPWLGHPGGQDAAEEYLARGADLSESERAALLQRVHPLRRDPTLHCTQCHTPEGSLVDLKSVGYPPARIDALVHPLIMQAIEHMVEGRPFYMPGFLTPDRQPATQPATPDGP